MKLFFSKYLWLTCLLIPSFIFSQGATPLNIDPTLLQNPIIKNLADSLLIEINDTVKVRLLNSLSWNLADVDFEAGKKFGDSAFVLANKLGLELEKGTALNNIGEILSLKGNISESISKHLEALKIFKSINNHDGIANTYKLLGFAHFNISDFKKSLELFNAALEIYQNTNNNAGVAIIHNYLGNLYGTIDDDNNALKHFEKALSYAKSIGDNSRAAVNLGNIGLLYFKKNNFNKALKNYLQALKVFKSLKQELNYSVYLGNAGLAYIELRDFSKAKLFFDEALLISIKLKNSNGIAFQYSNLGTLYYKMATQPGPKESSRPENLKKSVDFLSRAISIVDTLGLANDKKNYLYQLYDAHREMGNYKSALEAYIKASSLKDSILSESTQKAIAELEIKQRLKEKDNELKALNSEKKRQELMNQSLIAILILLAIIISLVVYTSLKQKNINTKLKENIRKREEIEKALRLNEIELQKYQCRLEKLVAERTNELEEEISERLKAEKDALIAKEKAENSDKAKTEFLAQISHEIRTPLNIINGFNTIIREELKDNTTPLFKNAMANLETASHRIIRTVDMVLKMSELTLGTARAVFKKFNFREVIVEELFDKYTLFAKEKKLSIDFIFETTDTIVNSDDYYVFQIFANLLDNAVKYTELGGIKMIIKRNKNKELSVDVVDSGIGISDEFLPTIFDSFTQEEQGYTRRYEGNGLGLSLVINYCKLIGAQISVISEKGKGSVFTLTFPNI